MYIESEIVSQATMNNSYLNLQIAVMPKDKNLF